MCLNKQTIIVSCKMRYSTKQVGFSIVELLIVITVIGILAAIVILSYSGIQNSARDSAVKTDLRNISEKLELYYLDNKTYPRGSTYANLGIALQSAVGIGFSDSLRNGNNMIYCVFPSAHAEANTYYALAAVSKSNNGWIITSSSQKIEPFTAWSSSISGTALCPTIRTGLGNSSSLFHWGQTSTGEYPWK